MSTASEGPGSQSASVSIVTYPELADPAAARARMEEIWLVSAARQRAADAASRQAFVERWLEPYLRDHADTILLALDGEGEVLGLLTGCLDSAAAAETFEPLHPYYRLFADLYADYPAHLHINCHPGHRDRGIGSRLINRFAELCAEAGLPGLHLITAPGARNVAFYRRNGFTDAVEREKDGRGYLFLGRRLA